MPFSIIRNDIAKVSCDAVVSPDDSELSMSGGASLAIARAAGEGYGLMARALAPLQTGKAAISIGGDLPSPWVIHTVAPVYEDGLRGEELILRSCYRSCLELAAEKGLDSIAFPLLGSGSFGYPAREAIDIANEEIASFLSEHDMDVILVVFDRHSFELGRETLGEIEEYIDEHYARVHAFRGSRDPGRYAERARQRQSYYAESGTAEEETAFCAPNACESREPYGSAPAFAGTATAAKASEFLSFEVDEGFSDTLLRLIDEKGMSDSQCYRKANLDRKLFSKIRSNPSYHPSKATVIALAMALELDMNGTERLLRKAGYALSDSYLSDVIVSYFISHREYDLFKLNEVLFHYDLPLIGQ